MAASFELLYYYYCSPPSAQVLTAHEPRGTASLIIRNPNLWAVQRARSIAGASMCKKEKKDKKEKKAKKAKSSGAGASAAQCTLKLVEEHKDLLSPLLSTPSRPPAATARPACLPACPPACLPAMPAMPAHPRLRDVFASQCRFLPGCFRPSA